MNKKHWFFRVWVRDRAGALTSIASAFSNRGISIESVVGHGADPTAGCDGTVLVAFTCQEDEKDAMMRVLQRLSKVERVEEHPYLGDYLRKTAVVKTSRALGPRDLATDTKFLTFEAMHNDSTGWTYFLGGPPNELDPILLTLKESGVLLDQVYSITAL